MKLICNGNDLSEAVSKVLKAVSAKAVNPVMEGILLKAVHGSVTLTASDSDLTIEKTFPADVKIEGETVVPGRLFSDFVRRLSKEQIELSLNEKNVLKIKYAQSEGSMQCLNPNEFPKVQNLENGQVFIILRNELKDLISKTAFSVCSDDSRPILKGVLLEVSEGFITAVALDGYRLAKCVKPIEKSTALMSAVVPARALTEIARLIDESVDPIAVSIQKNFLKLDLEHTRVTSRLLEGDFISYKQIIPDFFNSEVTLSRLQFEESLERAVLLSRSEKNNPVRLDISADTMMLSSNNESGTIEEKLAIKLNGNDLTIAFNAKYFIELIKYIPGESICIKFTNAISPCIIESSAPDKDVMYLVLPVRITNQ